MKGACDFSRIGRLAHVAQLPGFRLDTSEPTFPNGFYRLYYYSCDGLETRRYGCVLQKRDFTAFADGVSKALQLVRNMRANDHLPESVLDGLRKCF